MFEDDHGGYAPQAKFFPSDPNDTRSINNLLKPYIHEADIFFCPALPTEFNRMGINYLWNDTFSGQSKNSIHGSDWLMTEITATDARIPQPHTGGFGILYADGHVQIGPRPEFPKVEAPAKTELKELAPSQTVTSVAAAEPEKTQAKPTKELSTYHINVLPLNVTAGKPVIINVQALDRDQQVFDTYGTISLFDLSGGIEPKEMSLKKGTGEIPVVFKEARKGDHLFAYDDKGNWTVSNEFSVNPSVPAKLEISAPSYIAAGQQTIIRITGEDEFGNKVIFPDNSKISVTVNYQAEYPKEVSPLQSEEIPVTVTFFKSGDNRVQCTVQGTETGKEITVKVSPGVIDHFEISPIKSPLEAGKPLQITVKAVDKWGNKIKGFQPGENEEGFKYLNEDLSSGLWIETITFTKAAQETVFEIIDGFGHKGDSNPFKVIPSVPKKLVILPLDLTFIKSEECRIPFVIFDEYGNPVPDQTGNVEIQGLDNAATLADGNQYIAKGSFSETGRQTVTLRMKTVPDINNRLECLVLPSKPVLK